MGEKLQEEETLTKEETDLTCLKAEHLGVSMGHESLFRYLTQIVEITTNTPLRTASDNVSFLFDSQNVSKIFIYEFLPFSQELLQNTQNPGHVSHNCLAL